MTDEEAQKAARTLIGKLAGIAEWADEHGKGDTYELLAVGQTVLTVADLRLAKQVVAHVDARG